MRVLKLAEASPPLSAPITRKTPERRPSGIRELITLLSDYATDVAQGWVARLLDLFPDGFRIAKHRDGLTYTVDRRRVRPASRVSWLPCDAPHTSYTAERPLARFR